MRWLIVGHSGTEGSPAVGGTPWPVLLQSALNEEVRPVEVLTFRFWPAGPRAVSYALGKVDEFAPEGVILDINGFPAAVTLVAESVRARFGNRAHSTYLKLENALVARADGPAGVPGRTARLARTSARAVLGARASVDLEDSARVYAQVLRGLLQREAIETVVLAEASFGPLVRGLHPKMDRMIARLQAPARALARDHRIPWIDATAFVAADGEAAWAPDNVHLSALGNERYAAGIAIALGELRQAERGSSIRL